MIYSKEEYWIQEARYNKNDMDMRIERRKLKIFLKKQAVKDGREKGKGIRVLIRLSYGNMKEDNKY